MPTYVYFVLLSRVIFSQYISLESEELKAILRLYIYTRHCVINPIWGLKKNYDYGLMVMFGFICMGSTELFGIAFD